MMHREAKCYQQLICLVDVCITEAMPIILNEGNPSDNRKEKDSMNTVLNMTKAPNTPNEAS